VTVTFIYTIQIANFPSINSVVLQVKAASFQRLYPVQSYCCELYNRTSLWLKVFSHILQEHSLSSASVCLFHDSNSSCHYS